MLSKTENLSMIGLFISIFIAIVMGFVIGALIEDLALKDVHSDINELLEDELRDSNILDTSTLYTRLNAKDPLIAGLNIIDSEGIILVSDEPSLVGKVFSDKAKISKAVKNIDYYVIDRNLISQETISQEDHGRLLLSFYHFDESGLTVQILYDIRSTATGVLQITSLLWFTILLSVGVLFVVLLSISKITRKTLEEAKKDLEIEVKKRTAELEKLSVSLEEQIKKRTKTLESTNKELIKKSLDLRESEENMKIFMKGFESSPNSQSIVEYKNNKPKILQVNDAFLNYYGFSKKEVIGRNPNIVKSKVQNKDHYIKMWGEILDPKIGFWKDEIVNKRKDGSLIDVILTIRTIFDEKKKPIYFFASHVDITERKKATERLKEQNKDLLIKSMDLTELKGKLDDRNYELEFAIKNLNEHNKDLIKKTMTLTELQTQLDDKNFELEKANKEILSLMKVRTEFISRAAHDLRTPITPIMLLLPTIKKRIKDKDVLYDISIIERNTNYLRNIANNLISYLKSQTGKYTYVFKKENIKRILDDVLSIYEESFKQNKISVRMEIPSKLPLVELDELKITEVVQNIVSNALKFMPKGGSFTVSAKKIDNIINIRFEDTGIGMKKDALSKIFDEFYKADLSRHFEGEGLGLSICKQIIEDHHGKVWAESEGYRKGTTMSFNLPIKQK